MRRLQTYDIEKLISVVVRNLLSALPKDGGRYTYAERQVFKDIAYQALLNDITPIIGDITFDKVMNTVIYKEHSKPYYASDYFVKLDSFFSNDIYKQTGLTLSEFMNLTYEDSKIIKDFILARMEATNKTLDELKKSKGERDLDTDLYTGELYDL